MKGLPRCEKINAINEQQEKENPLYSFDKKVAKAFISAADTVNKSQTPSWATLNEARLTHQLWRIVSSGTKTRRSFVDGLARKLKLRVNQEEWTQPASKLSKANKVRKQMENKVTALRAIEGEANILCNVPKHRHKESTRKEITHIVMWLLAL